MTKINPDFLKRMQSTVEPDIKPGETAIEAIQRIDAEKVAALSARTTPPQVTPPMPPSRFVTTNPAPGNPPPLPATPAVQEVVFVDGHKLPRNFFTCLALCIMKLDNPEITEMFEKFGFEMKDLDGKPVVLKKKAQKKKK